jgi:deoxyribodipyrimidine photo-lyase
MIDETRIHLLNNAPVVSGKYVLYWMQASQRAVFNPALEYAITRANELKQPVVVAFGLMDDYPEANARHYYFLLEGLADVKQSLAKRNISFVVAKGQPAQVALIFARNASMVVCDRGYLRHQRRWRDEVADGAQKQVVEVEGDVVVPIELVSDKLEFAARTIRPKINRLVSQYLKPLVPVKPKNTTTDIHFTGNLDLSDLDKLITELKLDRSVSRSTLLIGGHTQARKRLDHFVSQLLANYKEGRREPSVSGTSMMAAYLHFGQISPVEIALAVNAAKAPAEDREVFLEELIVRRELAMNFVYYQPHYDQFTGLPNWARQSLLKHTADHRPKIYSRQELETARTADPYWNAAQKEMIHTGYMHNMMRMYWGKKILEWKPTPQEAYEDAIYLNNKYFLCGRDPASYANVGWLFGLHDRPWTTRPIFGTIRYMNSAGLDRKFDMHAYVEKINALEGYSPMFG